FIRVAKQFELMLFDILDNVAVLPSPTFQTRLLSGCRTVFRRPCEQFEHQSLAGSLERPGRTLKSFEEARADKTDDLLLPVLGEGIDRLIIAGVIGQRI